MSDEASIVASLQILNGNLEYHNTPTSFTADVTGVNGPTPGAITVPTTGIDVDLSQLTTPGLCWMMNLDDTNYVTYGIWDPETYKFYPFGKLKPGETSLFRLSPNICKELGTGTGTTGPVTNTFHMRADTAECVVGVEAFED